MQVLRDMNVALKEQLTEALQRIDELQLVESISHESLPAVPVQPPQVHRCCIDLEPVSYTHLTLPTTSRV